MKTPTKQTAHRLAAVLAIITALATTSAWAATNVDWGGGSGGSESAPLDVYDLSNWSGVSALSDAYDLTFDACNVPTVLTNSCATAATTKIANGFKLNYGTWTLLGDYKFSSIDANNSGTEPKVATIVKKGDWELTYAAYLGRSGATTIVTNVSGNIVQSGTSWFQIGNGNGGTAIVENLSGDWTIKGALELGHGAGSRGELYWRGGNLTQTYTGSAFSLGWGDNTSAVVEKYAGDWTTTDTMIVAKGNNSTASFKHNGGDLNVDGDFYCSYASNSVATVEKNGGDWTLKVFSLGNGAESDVTFIHRGGSMIVSGDLVASSGSNSVVTIEKDAGDWTLANLKLGQGGKNVYSEAKTTFNHNGGTTSVSGQLDMTYFGSCDFYMNGGEVTVGNQVRFGTWILKNGWHHATVNLNGGILSAKGFYLHNSDDAKLSKVVFDGGTFKASASGCLVSGADTRYDIADNTKLSALRASVGIDVGPKGGTIDTAGHDITNVVNFTRTSGSGGMRFVGGGTFTQTGSIGYTGKTSVAAGTTVRVDSSKAATILSHGLVLAGAPVQGTPYTILASTEETDDWSSLDLANVTCPVATEFTAAIGEDGKSVVVTMTGALKTGFWTGAVDNDLSNAANWSDGVVPTSGSVEFDLDGGATLSVGDTFAPDTITFASSSAVLTIGAGNLQLNTLTNASKLAIAQGASLTVAGDLVVGDGQGTFLYSNEGTVTVAGNAVCANTTKATTTKQFEVVTENTQPIQAAGLRYNIVQSGRIFWRLESNSTGAGAWVVGENGLKFENPENRDSTRFYAQNNPVTLYSSANWTLANTGLSNTSNGDLQVYDSSSLTIDTTDYDDRTTAHTVTLGGRIKAEGNVTIAGCGTVEVATEYHSGQTMTDTTIASGKTLAVADSATLKVNAGKKILGEGTISLAAGTTLALDSSALGKIDATEFTPCIPGLALPTTGAATIKIDGTRLRSGEHVLCTLASVPENLADHVTVTGTALDGRKYEVRVENGKLVLNILSSALKVIFR